LSFLEQRQRRAPLVSKAQAGTYHILVSGYSSYSGASLTASYTSSGGELSNGVPETDLSGAIDSQVFYTLEVPAGATGLSFELSGGTGDADLYVSFGAPPSTTVYDCESGNIDNRDRRGQTPGSDRLEPARVGRRPWPGAAAPWC